MGRPLPFGYFNGLRRWKITDGVATYHYWDGDKLSMDWTSSVENQIDGSYIKFVQGVNLIASVRAKALYVNNGGRMTIQTVPYGDMLYYLYNAHGDVVQLTDESGSVVKSYDYDAFGVEREPDEDDANPYRYCGEYFDRETGTVYLRARYYDPGIGRFTRQDAWEYGDHGDPLSLNLYTYCKSNPVRFIDPSGNKPGDLFSTVDKAAIDFAEYINGTSISEDLEYGASIYTVTHTRVTSIPVRSISGGIIYIPRIEMYTYYTYTEPNKGTQHKVEIQSAPFGHKRVAAIHTHGAYQAEYFGDGFSSGDFESAADYKIPFYLITPGGVLKRFDTKELAVTVIRSDMSYDSNHPNPHVVVDEMFLESWKQSRKKRGAWPYHFWDVW